MSLVNHFIALFIESAPWLILGFFVAGIMKVLIPQDFLSRHLGGSGLLSVVKAAIFGAPMPLCSCGVIPAALGLRRAGASKASTTSFLISTPETGVDSIAISYALLGPLMAILRPIAAISSAITAGILVGKDGDDTSRADIQQSCCSKEDKQEVLTNSLLVKLREGLRFSFFNLVKDIAIWLLIGLLMAALIQTFVPKEFLLKWGDGFLAFVVMALIGVPMYVCATASTPIAAGLLFSGVSPGAVLVFMLVGPATNIATIALVKAELGTRSLIAYLTAVVGVSFIFGFFLNLASNSLEIDFSAQTEHAAQMVSPLIASSSAVLLAILIVIALFNKYSPVLSAKISAA